MNYTLNVEAAKQADSLGSFINEKGEYIGIIEYAETYKSQGGADMVGFKFKSDEGKEATLQLCTHGKAGQEVFGFKTLMSIMTVLKARELTSEQVNVMKYDFDAKAETNQNITILKELSGQRIRFLLVNEQYLGNDGTPKNSMKIKSALTYADRLTGIEVLNQTNEGRADKILASLKDKLLDQNQAQAPMPMAGHDVGDSFEDDIPF